MLFDCIRGVWCIWQCAAVEDKGKGVKNWGWRDGSEVKSTDCASRGPEFWSHTGAHGHL